MPKYGEKVAISLTTKRSREEFAMRRSPLKITGIEQACAEVQKRIRTPATRHAYYDNDNDNSFVALAAPQRGQQVERLERTEGWKVTANLPTRPDATLSILVAKLLGQQTVLTSWSSPKIRWLRVESSLPHPFCPFVRRTHSFGIVMPCFVEPRELPARVNMKIVGVPGETKIRRLYSSREHKFLNKRTLP